MNARKLSEDITGAHDCKTCRCCRRKAAFVYAWGGNTTKSNASRWVCFICKDGSIVPDNPTKLIPVTDEIITSLILMFNKITDFRNDEDILKQNKEVWAAIRELSKHDKKSNM